MAPRTAVRRAKGTTPGVKLEVDGKEYVIRESDISPRDVSLLRRETGFSWVGLSKEMSKDPDIDLLAALVWLARHLAGEDVTYDTVLDSMDYSSKFDITAEGVTDEEAEATSPEA